MSKKAFITLLTLVFYIATFVPAAAAQTLYGAKAAKADSSATVEKMLTYALEQEHLIRAQADEAVKAFQSKDRERLFARIRFSADKRIREISQVAKNHNVTVEDKSAAYVKRCNTSNEAFVVLKELKKESLLMYQQFLTKDLPDDVKAVFTQIIERATIRPPSDCKKDSCSRKSNVS